jgi:hypothetical protein
MEIKTHALSKTYSKPHFFVLSRGKNTGKPLTAPCPNCYVVLCNDETQRLILFQLCFGLWQSQTFHFWLHGSVIEFINLRQFRKILQHAYSVNLDHIENIHKVVELMHQLNAKKALLQKQISLLTEMHRSIFLQHFKISRYENF